MRLYDRIDALKLLSSICPVSRRDAVAVLRLVPLFFSRFNYNDAQY